MRDLSPWSRFGVLKGEQMPTSYLLYTFVKYLSMYHMSQENKYITLHFAK